jgi:excisionase family DNA binding protein
MKEASSTEYLNLKEAAERARVQRQAIYVAIRKKNLPAIKKGRFWLVSASDLEQYRLNKYNSENKVHNGDKVYDEHSGHYSVQRVCFEMSIHLGAPYPKNHVYYLIRTFKIDAIRKGHSWVIPASELERLKHQEKMLRELFN